MIGRQLAHFRVTAKLGEGGMGEVYRATDTKLDREVALKVLPEALANDEERLARFEREAKVLASLNHPGIAGIHSLEKADGFRFLTMELVPGEPLDARLARGPIPIDESVELARQMVVAIEAAHERGIVHRDLKPANVMVTPEGDVKILDFGLAKAVGPEAASGSSPILTQSPTITHQMTQAGVLMGTAAYMSPEQARGHEADKRSDIWSFGVMLLEMLSGKNSFGGDTVSDTLAAVLRAEPDLGDLPAETPVSLRRLLERCLEKDPHRRLRDIGEARIVLENGPGSEPTAPAAPVPAESRTDRRWPWAIAALAIVAVASLGWRALSSNGDSLEPRHLSISVPPGLVLGDAAGLSALDISQDGELLAFIGNKAGRRELYLRDLATGETRRFEGTEGADAPFFSPDGRWIAFYAYSALRKVAITGGAPIDITEAFYTTGSWGDDGTIVFHRRFNAGLSRISATGGPVETLTEPGEGELGHFFPQFLADGSHVLFTAMIPPVEQSKVMVLSLADRTHRVVQENASHGRVTANGFLVFARAGGLWAVRWDTDRLDTVGAPVRVLEDFAQDQETSGASYAVADNGLLVYVPWSLYEPEVELLSLDRSGRPTPLIPERARWLTPALSPDGRRLAVSVLTDSFDLWLFDLERGTRSRLASSPRTEWAPAWRTSEHLAYSRDDPPYNLYEVHVDGTGRRLLYADSADKSLDGVSPDGRLLAFSRVSEGPTARDIWFLEHSAADPSEPKLSARPFFEAPGWQDSATFSPYGSYVAYHSDESGRFEVYMRPVEGGPQVQVSLDGGEDPLWRRNEIFFRHENQFLVAPVAAGSPLKTGEPRLLFEGEYASSSNARGYDVSSDGQQIIVVRTPPEFLTTRAHVILNWFEELERKYRGGGT